MHPAPRQDWRQTGQPTGQGLFTFSTWARRGRRDSAQCDAGVRGGVARYRL